MEKILPPLLLLHTIALNEALHPDKRAFVAARAFIVSRLVSDRRQPIRHAELLEEVQVTNWAGEINVWPWNPGASSSSGTCPCHEQNYRGAFIAAYVSMYVWNCRRGRVGGNESLQC